VRWWLVCRRMLLLSPFFLVLVTAPALPQTAPMEATNVKARVDAAALALAGSPRFKGLSATHRQALVEFVVGNMMFTLLHELAHGAIHEMRLPVLGREEDAADSFAATRLIKIGSEFSEQVAAEAAKGWFLADRRDQKEGDSVPYYDEHGLNQVRAYQIVCFVVGSNVDKFQGLARETKLPRNRQESCQEDYSTASDSWDEVLKPHLRTPDQPETQISVVYGEAKGRLAVAAQVARSIKMLEITAQRVANQFVWPAPIAVEMQSCGHPNSAWHKATRVLTLCYELAADFGDLYRAYNAAPTDSRRRKSK
jgi:hypothetical protein